MEYSEFFTKVTGNPPYPYQQRLGEEPWPELLDIPTGLGKTAAVVVAWLWKRLKGDLETPRRLVYCLPMRVLVEQTNDVTRRWLVAVRPFFQKKGALQPQNYLLMGGEVQDEWQLYPDEDCILIGTQDQLLSRALNRGYATSRGMWPWHFSFLNNDCLWVVDETQLMGAGLSTTAQLQAFRERLQTFGPTRSLWVSATLDQKALETVDSPSDRRSLALSQEDIELAEVARRLNGNKAVSRLDFTVSDKKYAKLMAEEILRRHNQPGQITLAVLNRVARAQAVFTELKKIIDKYDAPPMALLIHGRFRPFERQELNRSLRDDIPETGGIIVATQAVEAGVDLDARVLITELAPWSSLVQRFGRCNRAGLQRDAQIYWVDIPEKGSAPYQGADLAFARKTLSALDDGSLSTVRRISAPASQSSNHMLRRKDLLELFDTTADLTGADIDISRYIREGDDKDIQIYWRGWEGSADGEPPPGDMPKTQAAELCNVGIIAARSFLENHEAWRWDFVAGEWISLKRDKRIWPGIVLLLPETAGGYDGSLGWTGDSKHNPPQFLRDGQKLPASDTAEEDADSFIHRFVTLNRHLVDTVRQAEYLRGRLSAYRQLPWDDVLKAAHRHDVGKAHPEFQEMLLSHLSEEKRVDYQQSLWAKSDFDYYGVKKGCRNKRRYFRHELASALAMLINDESDLSAYLTACHHGKVRLSIRSQAGERAPDNIVRFARGIWEGDRLPETDIGKGAVMPETLLTLSYMELGRHPLTGISWLERALQLLEQFGPFRLALLETLVRVADWRASIEEGKDE